MYPQQPYPQGYPAPQPAAGAYPQMPPAPQYGNPYAVTSPHAPAVYGGPAAPQQAAQPLAAGSLDQFYSQPGGGNKAWSFIDPATKQSKPIGTTFVGVVARPLTDADVQQQTDPQTQQPQFFRDGRPKFVLVVPMQVQPDAEFPDGQAAWFCRGQARDELARAMYEAGAPEGPPEAGAVISVTLASQRPPTRAGLNPRNVYAIRYQRPQGTPYATPPAQPAPVAQAPALHPAPVPGGVAYGVPGQGVIPPAPQPVQQAPAYAPPQPVMQQPAPMAPATNMAPQLTPEQAALLAQLTGAPAAG